MTAVADRNFTDCGFTDFSPKRILVCQLRQLGDVLLATPALELLRKRFPDAELHVLTESKCVPLLDNNPHVNRVWGLDKKALVPFFREIAWYWKLASTGYDLVVDFQQLPRCRWVVGFSRAPVRLSYTPPWYTRLLYTHFIDPEDGYAAFCKASILEPLGIHWSGEKPRIYLTADEQHTAHALLDTLGLRRDHTLVTLDPTHRQQTRRWPLAHYAELCNRLSEVRPDIRILPLWGPGEEQDIRELVSLASRTPFLLPPNMLSLREMAAVISQARLHIGNCSAPRHMAVAVDTPTLVPLGSTSEGWTYPSSVFGCEPHVALSAGLSCQPCNRNTCPHCNCLTALLPSCLVEKALEML